MGEGLQFAALATLVGKKNGALWCGARPVTIGAVGWRDGSRFIMGTLKDGTVVFGETGDFSPAPKRRRGKAKSADAVARVVDDQHEPTTRA